MYVPMPALIAVGVALLVLLLLFALRRRADAGDLLTPSRIGPGAAPPYVPPRAPAWPAGAAPIGDLPPDLAAEVRALLAQGDKIEAIKLVRAATGLGLAEAKEMVERM